MDKKLIVDFIPFEITPRMISESIKTNNGRLIVSGVLQRVNSKNQNGRIYPRAILEREVQKYYPLIKERRALGELDHPESTVVNLSNVSHLIIGVKWSGDDLIGNIEILDTPSGIILTKLFEAQVKLGISSRGLGSVNEIDEETVEVNDDFDLIAWDFVSNPSTHGAFMKPITEGINKQLNNQIICRNKVECLIRDILINLK